MMLESGGHGEGAGTLETQSKAIRYVTRKEEAYDGFMW